LWLEDFVNPLPVLSFYPLLRREGEKHLVPKFFPQPYEAVLLNYRLFLKVKEGLWYLENPEKTD
jgi:hypothetical protein